MKTIFLKGIAGLGIGFCLLIARNSPLALQDYGLFVVTGLVTGICIPFLIAKFFQNHKLLGFITILAPFSIMNFTNVNYSTTPTHTSNSHYGKSGSFKIADS